MIHCQKCGKPNVDRSNFCRYCGKKFEAVVPPSYPPKHQPQNFPQRQQDLPIEQRTPRPYAWKTDEFDLGDTSARKTSQIEKMPFANDFGEQQMTRPLVAGQDQTALSHDFRCPHCGTTSLPFKTRKISSGGWIAFALLLIFFFPLFWVGFLMKEDVFVCSSCDSRIN